MFTLGLDTTTIQIGFNLCRTNHLIAPESANIIFVCTLTYIEACSMLYSLCWLRLGLKPSKDIAKLSRNVLRYTKYVQVDNKDSLLWLLKWLHKFESLRDFQIGPSLLLVGTPHTKLDSILRQIDQQLQQRKTLLRNIVKDEKGNLQAAFE